MHTCCVKTSLLILIIELIIIKCIIFIQNWHQEQNKYSFLFYYTKSCERVFAALKMSRSFNYHFDETGIEGTEATFVLN
jgi:hypothetical protein